MGIYRSEIVNLRKDIEEKVGQKIVVKESPGKRSKPLEKVAVIENVYPDFFRVKFENSAENRNYNYADVFTRSIELQVFNGESYTPIEIPQIERKKNRTLIENS